MVRNSSLPGPAIRRRFNWSDTAPILNITNIGPGNWVFLGACIEQGSTGGSVTAGVVTVSTPNTDYQITTPATFPANGAAAQDGLGQDLISEGQSLTAVVDTASGSAKEATLDIYLGAL